MRVIVLSLNRCRLDYLGPYGAELAVTPHLNLLATQSVVFDRHFVDQLGDRPTRRSWHGGCFDAVHPPDGLAARLWDAGIATVLFGDERSPTRQSRFSHGWERVSWMRQDRLAVMNQPTLTDGTLQSALDWIETHGTADNWLAWIELDSLRPPWNPKEYLTDAEEAKSESQEEGTALEPEEEADDAEALKDDSEIMSAQPDFELPSVWLAEADAPPCGLIGRWQIAYSGIVTYVDDLIGQFVNLLSELQLLDEVCLIVTSDSGLPMGEHEQVGEVFPWLHEEATHIPLMLRLPKAAQASRRVQQLTQPVDLPVTILDLFGLRGEEPTHGRSLLAAAQGQPLRREYICSRGRAGDIQEWSLRTQQWHYLLPLPAGEYRGPQLYMKPEDRWELSNVLEQHPDVADHLELTLRRFMAHCWHNPAAEPPALRKELLQIRQ